MFFCMHQHNEGKHDDALLTQFGIVTSKPRQAKQMLEVKARVLDAPSVIYSDSKPLRANNGQWRMQNKRFVSTVRIEKWLVIWMVTNTRISVEENQFTRDKFLEGI